MCLVIREIVEIAWSYKARRFLLNTYVIIDYVQRGFARTYGRMEDQCAKALLRAIAYLKMR